MAEDEEEVHACGKEFDRPFNHLIDDKADSDVFNKTFGDFCETDSSFEHDTVDAMDSPVESSQMTGITFYEDNVKHYCVWDPEYEENPRRFTRILERMRECELVEKCFKIPPRKATPAEVLLVHSADYVKKIEDTVNLSTNDEMEAESSKYDAVFFNKFTYESALYSVGSTVDMAEAVATGRVRNGFAVVRPPGHHAMTSEACGFCFFNNVAIAAEHCRKKLGLERILIVDWDVHHGQATQQTFYNTANVLYASIHRYELGTFWPELIESNYNFTGDDNGRGFNINVPLNDIHLRDEDYLAIWFNLLLPIFYEFDPQLVLISSGYDAAIGCPEGEMLLTPSFYAHATHSLMALANGKVCAVLEGGYCIESLADGAMCTLRALLGEAPAPIGMDYPIKKAVVETVLDSISVLRSQWKFLCMQNTYDRHLVANAVDAGDEEHLQRERYPPKLGYEGTKGYLLEKPTSYPTRGFNPVQDKETKERYHKAILTLRNYVEEKHVQYGQGKRTCLVTLDKFGKKHKAPGTHPERPNRLRMLMKLLSKEGLYKRCHVLPQSPRIATDEELLLCHTPEAIEIVKAAGKMKLKDLSEYEEKFDSIYFSHDTYEVACEAVGSLLAVVDTVLSNECRNGLAAIRPPGHHAGKDKPAGFCFFNNVAIAAHYAIDKYKLDRVLIVDWDIHQGDGTQSLVANNDKILFVSLHRYDHGEFWPNRIEGNYSTTGAKNIVNIPWSGGPMGDKEYLAAFFNLVMPLAYKFNPELVLVSNGCDGALGDPIGEYRMTPRLYGHLTHMLSSLANGKLVMALEGGYNLEATAASVCETIRVLLGDPPKQLSLGDEPINDCARETLANVIDYHASNWPILAFNVDIAESNL